MATKKKPAAKKQPLLKLVKNDPWLEPYADAIAGRYNDAINKEKELLTDCDSLNAFANAHHYFGLHRSADGWVFREWAPNATDIVLIGDFSNWQEQIKYRQINIDLCYIKEEIKHMN